MPYEYPIQASAMFEDRATQMAHFGVPTNDITQMRKNITDMWANAPGGWVYEWSKLGAQYAAQKNPFMASIMYGWAKFPCVANDSRREALSHQTEQYVAASPTFGVSFERRILTLPYAGKTVDVPVHFLDGPTDRKTSPVLILSGGVDTYKMDLHAMFVALAKATGLTVLAFDHPGTGETMQVPLNETADEVVLGIVKAARQIGNGRVAHLGMSFGGNFVAMTGLSTAVDAAVDIGGPVNQAFEAPNLKQLPYGMPDILGNAFGDDRPVNLQELLAGAARISRLKLLQGNRNAPMLVINGADDYFVPQADTLIFEGRPNTEVHLIPGTGHCCVSKFDEIMPIIINWLKAWAKK